MTLGLTIIYFVILPAWIENPLCCTLYIIFKLYWKTNLWCSGCKFVNLFDIECSITFFNEYNILFGAKSAAPHAILVSVTLKICMRAEASAQLTWWFLFKLLVKSCTVTDWKARKYTLFYPWNRSPIGLTLRCNIQVYIGLENGFPFFPWEEWADLDPDLFPSEIIGQLSKIVPRESLDNFPTFFSSSHCHTYTVNGN